MNIIDKLALGCVLFWGFVGILGMVVFCPLQAIALLLLGIFFRYGIKVIT